MASEPGIPNPYGDGATWFRGSMIGRGGFGSVYIATLKNPKSKFTCYPPIFAVKSAEVSLSSSIQKERQILTQINAPRCPYILRCYGDETTTAKNGLMVYNLLLEYASGGTLSSRIKNSGNPVGIPETEAKSYAKCILRGLKHIHQLGYIHCDLKPDNIFLFPVKARGGGSSPARFRAKIGDFGLAKRTKPNNKRKLNTSWEGTPMYLSPEAVVDKLQDFGSDVWAFGCVVVEMLTGRSMWGGGNRDGILARIGSGSGCRIPDGISEGAKSFLKGCFAVKPGFRFTADMLLNHPFLEGDDDDDDGDDDDDDDEEEEEIEEQVEDLNILVGSSECDDDDDDDDDDDGLCYYYSSSSTSEEEN